MITKEDLPNGFDWVNLDNIQFNRALDEVLNEEDNLFIQAKAGCGKSLIIKIASMQLKSLVVLSTTGTTAVQLSSTGVPAHTVHSFFRLGAASIVGDNAINKNDKYFRNMINRVNTIIIDEVSMLNAQIFDAIIKKIKKNRTKGDVPRLILFGDVLQLPPVIEKGVVEDYFKQNYNGNVMFFNSVAYKHLGFTMLTLTKSFRQTDEEFANRIYQIGVGMVSDKTLSYFNQRVMSLPKYSANRKHFVYMAPTNATVNKINQEYINNFSSDKEKLFKIEKSPNFPKGVLDDEILIKVGAQVMITKNNLGAGYSNGMLGTVTSIGDDSVSIETDTGKIVEVGVSEYTTYETAIENGRIVNKKKEWAKQLDCRICRAMTIHKSQGKTFDNAYIALMGWTPPGIVYVGLSRLTSLEGLGISRPINMNDIKVYKEAIDFLQSH